MAWDDSDSEQEKVNVEAAANWDDSEDEEKSDVEIKEVVNETATLSVQPKKMTLTQKIALRNAEEQQRKEERITDVETMNERRARETKQMEEADLQNAHELFGVAKSDFLFNLLIYRDYKRYDSILH